MLKRYLLLASLLLILISISGCINERSLGFEGKEQVYQVLSHDINGDGVIDGWTYLFQPVSSEGLEVQRVLKIQEIGESEFQETDVAMFEPLENSTFNEIDAHLQNFQSSRGGEEVCKSKLGIGEGCYSSYQCRQKCTNPACSGMLEAYGEGFLGALIEFSQDSADLDGQVGQAETYIESMKEGKNDLETTQNLLLVVGSSRELAGKIESNHLFDSATYGACTKPNYELDELEIARQKIERQSNIFVITKPTGEVEYTMFIILEAEKEGNVYTQIRVVDEVPQGLGVTSRDITLGSNFTVVETNPLSVVWTASNVGIDEKGNTMMYSLETEKGISERWLESNIKVPEVSIREVSFSSSPYFVSALSAVNALFRPIAQSAGYHAALAIVSVVLYILVGRFLWTLVRGVFAAMGAVTSKRSFSQALWRFAGHGKKDKKGYLAVAAILTIAGAALIFYSPSGITDTEIVVNKFILNFSKEPLKSIGSFLLFLGLTSFYFVLEDIVKGLVMGKRYYQTRHELLGEIAATKYQTLKQEAEELNNLLQKCAGAKIDVSGEKSSFNSISIKGIEAMMKQGQTGDINRKVEEALEKVEKLKNSVQEKYNTVNQNMGEWTKIIDDRLKMEGQVSEDMLIEIPNKWRRWVLEQYLLQNRGKGLIIENGALKWREEKVEAPVELPDLMKDLVASGKISAGMIAKRNGTVLASALPEGAVEASVSGICSKFYLAASILADESAKGATDYAIIDSEDGKLFVKGIGTLLVSFYADPEVSERELVSIANGIEPKIRDAMNK